MSAGAGRPRRRRRCESEVDPRPAVQILAEEAVLTKPMLAKVLGYRSVRGVDNIIMEDCASEAPCLRPVYLRRADHGPPQPGVPSFKSLRFRKEDVLRYIEKMQVDFPFDLEWKNGGGG
ncbi:MAG: hypothetical protein HYZ11_03920 [Candidatus Tectomicrobia bacterium]|uniref:Uncharacterized protein n=1 Tax=Tectimicrobiota bacterium TaxID=2528274 RepID=A0A932MMI7_UNCTE|nr:hypothetical protein [Candidatus Tectomicrobia bacterium]